MSAGDIRLGGAYVEVAAENDKLDEGLKQSAAKLKAWGIVARETMKSAAVAGGTAAGIGLGAVTLVGRGVANTMKAVGNAMVASTRGGKAGFGDLQKAVSKLEPVTTRIADVLSSGFGRGVRFIGTARQLLVAAGVPASKLLQIFDGISKKSPDIVGWARLGSIIRGDVAGAVQYNRALKDAREAFLANQRATVAGFGGKKGLNVVGNAGFAADWLNIRGGYAATAALRTGVNLTGRMLQGIGSIATKVPGVRSVASSVSAIGSAAATTARNLLPIPRALDQAARSGSRLQSIIGGLRSASFKLGAVGGGIMGLLGGAALSHSASITDLFSAHGFAAHATEMAEGAAKHGMSVEQFSAFHAAARQAGTTVDEAKTDSRKRAALYGQLGQVASIGGFVTADQVRLAKNANQALGEMQTAFRAVGTALGSAVMPQMIEGIQWITKMAAGVAQFTNKNPKLIQQLFQVGRLFAIGAGTAAALATAIGFLASPIGIITVGVGVLTAAFPTLWQSAKENFGSITGELSKLGEGFNDVLGGMINALMGGRLGLAAEIAWLGLQVAWEGGMLQVRKALDAWLPGWEKTWNDSINWLQDAWSVVFTWFADKFAWLQQQIAKGVLVGMHVIGQNPDLKGSLDTLNEMGKEDEERRHKDRDAAILAHQKARDAANANPADRSGAKLKDLQDKLRKAMEEAERAAADEKKNNTKKILDGAKELASAPAVRARETRGNPVHDIRTKEGLEDVLVAFRGNAKQSPVDIAKQGVAEQKKSNTELAKANIWNLRNWELLTDIDNNLNFPALPIR